MNNLKNLNKKVTQLGVYYVDIRYNMLIDANGRNHAATKAFVKKPSFDTFQFIL